MKFPEPTDPAVTQGPNALHLELGTPLLPPEVLTAAEDEEAEADLFELRTLYRAMLERTVAELRAHERLYEEDRLAEGSKGTMEPASAE